MTTNEIKKWYAAEFNKRIAALIGKRPVTLAQRRVLKVIGGRSWYAWPRDLENGYGPGYQQPLKALIKKGLVKMLTGGMGVAYQLADEGSWKPSKPSKVK